MLGRLVVLLRLLAVAFLPVSEANPANVVELGADATGQKDSSAAIQAAFDQHDSVLIPAGSFVLLHPLLLRSRLLVVAEPNATLLQRGTAAMEVPPNTTCYKLRLHGITIQYDRGEAVAQATDVGLRLRSLQHSDIVGISLLNYAIGPGQTAISIAPDFTAPPPPPEAVAGGDNSGNFVFNRFDQVEISKARVGFEYFGQAEYRSPATRFVSKGHGYTHDGHYTDVPVLPCNLVAFGAIGQDTANISISHGAVSHFAWVASSGRSFSFGECVTTPAAALGGLNRGGQSYVAEVFQKAQAIISNNVYRSVTIRHVTSGGTGVLARRWADTERWYDLYIMLSANNTTAISLGEPDAFQKIDRFMFHSPCLVYAPNVDPLTVSGVVLNPGTFRINLQDLHSDKMWPHGHVTDNSGKDGSYIMTLMSTGRGVPTYPSLTGPDVAWGPARYSKGVGTECSGRVVFRPGETTINVTTALVRAPRGGEVMLTPACNLAPRGLWLGEFHAHGFLAHLSAPMNSACPVDYRIYLGAL